MLDWSGIREIDLVMPSLLLLRKSWTSVLFHCWMLEGSQEWEEVLVHGESPSGMDGHNGK